MSGSSPSAPLGHRAVVAVIVVGWASSVAWLLFTARPFVDFVVDDAFISFRYAERLATGHGLTFTAGERVEGYSNLAWVLALAGLRLLGLSAVAAARPLGVACAAVALLSVAVAAAPRYARQWPFALVAPSFLAWAAPFAVWSGAGLETPMLAAALGLSVAIARSLADRTPSDGSANGAPSETSATPARRSLVHADRRWLHGLGACLAWLALCRPDGPLLGASVLVGLAFARGSLRVVRTACIWLAVAVAAQLAFRVAYYHALVPNTAHAKLAFTPQRVMSGLDYLRASVGSAGGLLVVAAIATPWSARPSARGLACATVPFVAWAAYVVLIGGDVFPAHRHAVPLAVLGAFAAADLASRLATRGAWGMASAAVCTALVAGHLRYGASHPDVLRATRETWAVEAEPVAAFLVRAAGARDPLLAVDPAGGLPYYTRFRSLDMLGLCDRTLAETAPPDLGQGFLGHELGDGAYVLARAPDLVVFCTPTGHVSPCFRGGQELEALPGFAASYALVRYATAGASPLRGAIWVRTGGERLGARWERGAVRIPGWLFSGWYGVAREDANGVVVDLPPGSTVEIPITLARTGTYRASVDAQPAVPVAIGLRGVDGPVTVGTTLEARSTHVLLSLRAEAPTTVREVRLVPVTLDGSSRGP